MGLRFKLAVPWKAYVKGQQADPGRLQAGNTLSSNNKRSHRPTLMSRSCSAAARSRPASAACVRASASCVPSTSSFTRALSLRQIQRSGRPSSEHAGQAAPESKHPHGGPQMRNDMQLTASDNIRGARPHLLAVIRATSASRATRRASPRAASASARASDSRASSASAAAAATAWRDSRSDRRSAWPRTAASRSDRARCSSTSCAWCASSGAASASTGQQ